MSVGALTVARMQLRRIASAAAREVEARIDAALVAARLPDDTDGLIAQAKALGDAESGRQKAATTRKAISMLWVRLAMRFARTMTTAFAERGRIVVRKPMATGYGVELGSTPRPRTIPNACCRVRDW